MYSVEISGKVDRVNIVETFSNAIGEVEYQKSYGNGATEATMLTGTKFFLRTSDNIGFCLFAYYDGISTKIDFGRIGGGSGLINMRWGAGDKVEEEIVKSLRSFAESQGKTFTSG